MQRFDPFKWNETLVNVEKTAPKGRLCLLCDNSAAFYVSAADDQGEIREVLAGVGTSLDITSEAISTFRIQAPKGTRAFLFHPFRASFVPEGEIFTNPDRMVTESGTLFEVRKALRQQQLEGQAILREVRQETTKARKLLRDAQKAEAPAQAVQASEPAPAKPIPQDDSSSGEPA